MIISVVCPFCERAYPVPTDFDSVYSCDCGASYKICSTDLLKKGMTTIATELGESPILEEAEEELCQVVVNHEFEQLISLKQSVDDPSQMRFCKYDPSVELALVWMKRPF